MRGMKLKYRIYRYKMARTISVLTRNIILLGHEYGRVRANRLAINARNLRGKGFSFLYGLATRPLRLRDKGFSFLCGLATRPLRLRDPLNVKLGFVPP